MAINTTKEDEELKESLKLDVLKRLLKNLLEYKGKIVVVTILILITVFVSTVYPLMIEKIIDDVDVLYVTRIQKERFGDINDYLNSFLNYFHELILYIQLFKFLTA